MHPQLRDWRRVRNPEFLVWENTSFFHWRIGIDNHSSWSPAAVYRVYPEPSMTIVRRVHGLRELNHQQGSFGIDDGFGIQQGSIGAVLSFGNEFVCLFTSSYHLSKLRLHGFPLEPHIAPLSFRLVGLVVDGFKSLTEYASLPDEYARLQKADKYQRPCEYFDSPLYLVVLVGFAFMGIIGGGFGLILRDSGFLNWNRRGLLGICIALCGIFGLGCDFSVVAFGSPLWFWSFRWIKGEGHDDKCYGEWHGINVTRKLLTNYSYCNTVIAWQTYSIPTSKSR